MHPHTRAVLQRPGGRDQIERRVHAAGHGETSGRGQRLTSSYVADLEAAKIDGSPLAGHGLARRRAMNLHTSDLRHPLTRHERQLVVRADPPRNQRASDHGSEASHRKRAVDRQPRGALDGAWPGARAARHDCRPQIVEAFSGAGRHLDDLGAFEERTPNQLTNLLQDESAHIGIDGVGFGQHDDAVRNLQQPADVEVLAGLRHHRLVARNDQQDAIDAADTGQHCPDEPLVPGDVDERDLDVADDRVREAELDRDAALFLFLEPIGVGAGERQDQCALAVVDVTRRADDDVGHFGA